MKHIFTLQKYLFLVLTLLTGARTFAQVEPPLYVLASSDRVCGGDTIFLRATCNHGTVVWYSSETGTNIIGTGAPLPVNPITNTTFYAACDYDFQMSTRVATQEIAIFVKPSMPTEVKVNKTSACRGSEIVLSGSCADGTLVWYFNESESDSLGTGNNFKVNAVDNTRYSAACYNGTCKSYRVSTEELMVVAVPDSPTQVTVDKTEICGKTGVTLTASCGLGATSWYNAAAGGPVLDAGTQYPSQTGAYYCACSNNICESARVPTMEIKVIPQPELPTYVLSSKTAVCKGESITLTANCSIGTVAWYTYPLGPRTFQGTGSGIVVVPDTTTTYFAACENGLCISDRVRTEEVVVSTHLAPPTNVAINYAEVCSGSPVSLTANFTNGTLHWYTAASGGTSIGTGTNLSHSPTANTTYYAVCENGACKSERIASSQLLVKPRPVKPIISGNATICNGETIQLLTSPSSSDATCYWSTGATGFSINVSPAANTRYRVLVKANSCTSDSSDAFTVTVNPLPQPPTITTNNPAICKGGSALLTGQAASPTDNFYWSTPTQGMTSNATSSSTRVVTEPGVYKGWSESAMGCISAERSIIILEGADCNGQNFITITPRKPVICPNTSIILTAVGCSGNITWIDGYSTYTGSAIKVSPGVTTTYMAQCSTGGMTGTDVVVAQTNVMVTNHIATGAEKIKALLTLESSKKIGEPDFTPAPNVSFEAGGSITLKPGFVAERFSTFSAVIRGCE
jgi:hypothetical protein